MKILHVSDVHGMSGLLRYALESLSAELGVDLIVISGDFEFYDESILSLPRVPVVAVTGNMDDQGVAVMLDRAGVRLDGKVTNIRGVIVCGIGGLSTTKDAVAVLSSASGKGVDILVSHYPPKGTAVDLSYRGVHIGKEIIRDVILEVKPRLCLCGHVHESRGIDRVGSTLVVNPGPLSRGYYALVDLNSLTVFLDEVRLIGRATRS